MESRKHGHATRLYTEMSKVLCMLLGHGSLLPSTEVGRGSLSPHCLSRGLSTESGSPGTLSRSFSPLFPILNFSVPSLSPVPRFSKLVSRTGPRFYELVPLFRIFCHRPCPHPKFRIILAPSLSPNRSG